MWNKKRLWYIVLRSAKNQIFNTRPEDLENTDVDNQKLDLVLLWVWPLQKIEFLATPSLNVIPVFKINHFQVAPSRYKLPQLTWATSCSRAARSSSSRCPTARCAPWSGPPSCSSTSPASETWCRRCWPSCRCWASWTDRERCWSPASSRPARPSTASWCLWLPVERPLCSRRDVSGEGDAWFFLWFLQWARERLRNWLICEEKLKKFEDKLNKWKE